MTTTENPVRNGVDTATLFATLDAVKGDTDLAKFQFRATNRWLSGTHNQSTIHGFPVSSSKTGTFDGSGMKPCIFWYAVWLCQQLALMSVTPR